MEKSSARNWDLPSALVMLAAVLFSSWRLLTTNWAEGLGQVQNVAVLAFGVGLALGYSRYERRAVLWLTLGYLVFIIPWQLMGALSFGEEKAYLADKLSVVFGRLFTGVKELLGGRAVEDQFFLIALLCLPFWFASLYSGYQLTRHANFLKSVLPNGVLMFIIHVYHYTSKDYTWMFSVYLFLALVLLSRLKYLEDRKRWAGTRTQVSSESGLDMTTTTVAVTTALILLAWSVPYILPPTAQGMEFWRKTYGRVFPPSRFENLFAAVDKENQPQPRNFQMELSLGTRTPQSDRVVFKVYAPQSSTDFPRLYWRAQVYDRYENGQWLTTSENETRRTPAEGDMEIPDSGYRRKLGFTFDIATNGQTVLFTPAQPVWVNHDALLLYSELPVGTEEAEVFDVMAMRATPPLEMGDLYRASAMLANPTIPELRQAGQGYPNWVLEKYLQLPEDFSPRIHELAEQIAAPYDNPYDRAVAITLYLRREINYSAIIVIPANANDPLEYVLFEGKEGYCNYYATLQVLMLRSQGIPARLAVGYAQGEPNLQNSIFVVRERDLHAWPEVYFPEIGWVEFEPTTNQDPLIRPETREENNIAAPFINPVEAQPSFEEGPIPTPELAAEEEPSAAAWQNGLAAALPWMGGVFFILLLVVLQRRLAPHLTPAFVMRKAIERSGWSPPKWFIQWLTLASLPVIERYFHSINIGLQWMKRPQPAHITPAERAWILKHVLPDAAESIETLLREHQAQLFSPQPGDEASARRAAFNILLKCSRKRLRIIILGYNYTEIQDPPRYPL